MVWNVLWFILGYLVYVVAWLMTMASFVFWAKLLIRAYQGQMYKIPLCRFSQNGRADAPR